MSFPATSIASLSAITPHTGVPFDVAANPLPTHQQSPGSLETSASVHAPPPWNQHDLEPQEQRAQELKTLGYNTMAERVRACGWTTGGFRTCKQRICPGCGARVARANTDRMILAVSAMTHPTEVLLAYRSKGLGAPTLRTAITAFRRGIRLLRERCVFRGVQAGVGAIETKVSNDNTVWLVHSHLALDIVGALDALKLKAAWSSVTGGRGTLDLGEKLNSIAAFSTYATKADTWCPPPGSVPLHLLEVVMKGVRGRRLMVAWTAKTGSPT